MSGEVDVANSGGRRNGTSAPYQRAISATTSESVERTTRSKPVCRAVAIAYAIRGWPASGRMFLFATRSERERAGTRAITLGIAEGAPRASESARRGGAPRARQLQ